MPYGQLGSTSLAMLSDNKGNSRSRNRVGEAGLVAQRPMFARAVVLVRRLPLLACLLVGLGLSVAAHAETFIWVADSSQIKYMSGQDGKVYIRNLSEFSSSALGCCYNYWIDTTTQGGRNDFALLLSAMAQHTGMYIGIPDGLAAGSVEDMGSW